jgi:tRNA-dihydrouridine synthase 2
LNALDPNDYDGLDVNMGCPEHFSVSGGMGSALLKDPKRTEDIVKTLVRNSTKPITCKIRLLPTMEQTIDFMKMLEQCGAKAITVHARYVSQRPRVPAHTHLVSDLVKSVSVPVIYNGDVFTWKDIQRLKNETGCSSVMVGRGALWNMSTAFVEGKEKPALEVCREYVRRCLDYENPFSFTKYTVLRMFENLPKKGMWYHEIVRSKTELGFLDIIDRELDRISKGLPDVPPTDLSTTGRIDAKKLAGIEDEDY